MIDLIEPEALDHPIDFDWFACPMLSRAGMLTATEQCKDLLVISGQLDTRPSRLPATACPCRKLGSTGHPVL